MNNWNLKVHNLFEKKKFHELLSLCSIILNQKIRILFNRSNILSEDNTNTKLREIEAVECLRKTVTDLSSDSYKLLIEQVISELFFEKHGFKWRQNSKLGIDDTTSCFEDINKLFSYISICCAEIKNQKLFTLYIQLSHVIVSYFIVGDLFCLHIRQNRKWNTEKVLISSVLKVSERILQNKNIEFDEDYFIYSYLLWELCLFNWFKYSEVRLGYSTIPNDIGKELVCLIKNLVDIFQFLSKSSLTYYHQTLLVYNIWCNIFKPNIRTFLCDDEIKDKMWFYLKGCDVGGSTVNKKCIIDILKEKILILLDCRIYEDVLEILAYLNILTGLLIGIIHKRIKYVIKSDGNSELFIEHIKVPKEISNLLKDHIENSHNELAQIDITDLQILKMELCLINCIIFARSRRFFISSIDKCGKIEAKFNKGMNYSFYLTIGIINSLSDLNFNEKSFVIIKQLLHYQNSSLSSMLCTGTFEDDHGKFIKSISSYASCLIENIIKKLLNKKYKVNINEGLTNDVVKSTIDILSLLSRVIENINCSIENKDKAISTTNLSNVIIKIKALTCETIIRYIQYLESITDDYFLLMKNIFEGLILDNIFMGNSDEKVDIDELVLDFILSINENLLRLSFQLRQKGNFKDSIKISTFGLASLSYIISLPWVISNDNSYGSINKSRDVKIIDNIFTENIDSISTPTNNRSFPPPFETINTYISKFRTETESFRNHSSGFIDSFNIKNTSFLNDENFNNSILNTPFIGTHNLHNLRTPFTTRLKYRSISQMKSHTVKKIQISTLNNYKNTRIRKVGLILSEQSNSSENCDSKSAFNDCPDYPIHILLFMLFLEQLISSTNSLYNENTNTSSDELYQMILLIKDNICKLCSQIDDFSFLFIFKNDHTKEFLHWNEEPLSSLLESDWFEKIKVDKRSILLKNHFSSILSSLVSRYVKTKLLLIEDFSADIDLIQLFPEISGTRNNLFQHCWIYHELIVYKNFRFEMNKYSKIFKNIIKNGFYYKFVDLFNKAISFDSNRDVLFNCKTKDHFLNLYNNRIDLFEFYAWLINFQKQCIKNDDNNNIHSFINEMYSILSDLEILINNSEVDLLMEIFLIELLALRIHLITECRFELIDNFHDWCKESFTANQRISVEVELLVGYLCDFFELDKNHPGCLNSSNLLNISYWITQIHESSQTNENNDKYHNDELYLLDNNTIMQEMDDDVPMPLDKNNKKKTMNLDLRNVANKKMGPMINKMDDNDSITRFQCDVKDNSKFVTTKCTDERSACLFSKGTNKYDLTSIKLLIHNFSKILNVIELQGIEDSCIAKLLNIFLVFFRSCWTFCIQTVETSIDNELVYNSIHCSLKNIIDNRFTGYERVKNQDDILIINIGIFISRLLYKAANHQKKNSSSNDHLEWLKIAHLYNKNLILMIENKYVLSKTFLGEKLPSICLFNEAILELIVLKTENIYLSGNYSDIFGILNCINNYEFSELSKYNIINIVLLSRLYRELSRLFMNTGKPELSLFFILECNKLNQLLIQQLKNYINDINPDCISTFSFNGISRTHIINVIIGSLIDLSVVWLKIGEVERSNRIFSKTFNFCREWTLSYNNVIKLFFFQLPLVLNSSNVINNLNDSNEFNCIPETPSIKLNYSSEIQELATYLCDVYCQGLQITSDKYLRCCSTEKLVLMILIYILLYFTVNNLEENSKLIKRFVSICQNDNFHANFNQDFTICMILKKVMKQVVDSKKIEIIDVLILIFKELNTEFDDYYLEIFINNILSYSILIISYKYTDMIALIINKDNKSNNSTISEKSKTHLLVNNITEEKICKTNSSKFNKIISISNNLIKKLTDMECIFSCLVNGVDFIDINENVYINKCKLDPLALMLHKYKSDNGKTSKTEISILNEMNDLFDTILHHLTLCIKHNMFILINNIISVVIDFSMLISTLIYPIYQFNSILSTIISHLTYHLSTNNSCIYIYSMRRIQKKFDNYKKKYITDIPDIDTTSNKSLFEHFVLIRRFIQEFDHDCKKVKKDDSHISNELIPRVHMRFSSFLLNLPIFVTKNTKFTLFQITRDISLFKNIKKNISTRTTYASSGTSLTLFYFIESSKIYDLLKSFDVIQNENVSSIIDVDMNQISIKEAKIWWERRINLELKLEKWLSSFSKIVFKECTIKLLFGFPKLLVNSKYNSKLANYIDQNLKGIKSIGTVDVILYSLFNNAPNLVDFLSSVTGINVDFSILLKNFNKIDFRNTTKCEIKNYPIIIFPDKLLMNLPIEGISDLSLQPITRGVNEEILVNNFNNLMIKLGKKGNNSCLLAKKCNIYYCINPSGDLFDTEKTIIPVISKLFKGKKCTGISSQPPQPISMVNDITVNSINLYLFCGHQGGERFINGEIVERGTNAGENFKNELFNFPPSLLIGCSSSKIRSYRSTEFFCTPLHYLIGGSPFVLGALWDVTDQDIDRFTLSIFDNWFKSNMSLLESITISRRSCKLPLLNGYSCICFGHPI